MAILQAKARRKKAAICSGVQQSAVLSLAGSAILLTVAWKAAAPHPALLQTPTEGSRIDVVGLAVKPTCVNKEAVKRLNRFFGPRRIFIVTSAQEFCGKFRSFGKNVHCLVEDHLIPGVTRRNIGWYIEKRFNVSGSSEFMGRNLAGWYFQQFLKMWAGHFVKNLSANYLVWDMDMLLLSKLRVFHYSQMFRNQPKNSYAPKTIVNIGGSLSHSYDSAYLALTNRSLERAPDGTSFVTHWMLVYQPYMDEFLYQISLSQVRQPAPSVILNRETLWVWRILDAIQPENLHKGFSEYASYISWVKQNHPSSQFILNKRKFVRNLFGNIETLGSVLDLAPHELCCPTNFLLGMASMSGYQYIGIEIGHIDSCNFTNNIYANGYGV